MRYRFSLILAILLLSAMVVAPPAQAQSSEPPAQELVYIVQPGETMFSIARRYGQSVDAVAHANGIADPRAIFAGQRLVIPGGDQMVSANATVPYVISAGDSLLSVANLYGTTWRDLVYVNHMVSPAAIYVGQVIQVPVTTAESTQDAAADQTVRLGTRQVIRGDDVLFRMALSYGVSTWTLAAVSHVADPILLHPGQELVIPGDGTSLLPQPYLSVQIAPLPVSQGQTFMVVVHTTEPVTLEGVLFDQSLAFAEEGGVYYALVGINVFAEPGLYDLDLAAIDAEGRRTALVARVVVRAGGFGYERIDLPADREALLDPYVIAGERDRLESVIYSFTPVRQWSGVFRQPAAGTISSYFGSRRSVNGGPYTSYHTGLDFRSPTGTPVYAAEAGTVVLAEPLAICGNTVILDHGWGVMTGYCHLSVIGVQVGQQVAAGELVGKVGNTGRSTGSHLHWEMWVRGTTADGLQWLDGFGAIPSSVSQ